LDSHPVAVAQYTFTHKQYIERHKMAAVQPQTGRMVVLSIP